ncbi:MBL fold metallo-hydrolase [Flammeovirga sp. SubArs3]|uniref:MBL fold metallo-hydrolase n=1 Tax=Flammeovirga sp. SubArs3 TaxID=2995316 RepID=UPI00248BF786|nr:MBL fold metallo-hydrolase [Flammeovirga sp. SubArs3]
MTSNILHISTIIDGEESKLYPTLIKSPLGNYLVDTGYNESYAQLEIELQKHGLSYQHLQGIIITHDDIDHIGCVKAIKESNRSIQIISSRKEKASLEGKVISERLEQAISSFDHLPDAYKPWGRKFIYSLQNVRRFKVNHTVKHQDELLNTWKVVETPGPTKGHISLFNKKSHTLIAGDAIVFRDGKLDIANSQFNLDLDTVVDSVKTIKSLSPKKIICFHGGEVTENIDSQLNDLIKKYSTFKEKKVNQFNVFYR